MRKIGVLGLVMAVIAMISFVYVESAKSEQKSTGPQGELVVLLPSLWSESWTLDAGEAEAQYAGLALTNEFLVRRNLEGQPEGIYPGLAERWGVSEDGRTYDFYLRKGVHFNEGWGECTAEDVKFSWEQAGKAGSKNSKAELFRIGEGGNTESITVIDPYHIRIKLVKPDVILLSAWLSRPYFLVLSKKYYEKEGYEVASKHPIGTGPWVMTDYKPGDYVKFEAVDNHYRQTPDFKSLTIRAVPEASTRLAMIKTGKADIDLVPPEYVDEVKKVGYKIKRVPGALGAWVAITGQILPTRKHYDPSVPWVPHQDEPADSEWNQRALKVRKALSLAIDKQAIIDKIFQGNGTLIPIRHWYPIDSKWSRPEWQPIPYDPEEAKRLLTEAGYPNGFKFELISYPSLKSPKNLEIGQALAIYWGKIGLTVKRNITEFPLLAPRCIDRDLAWTIYASASNVDIEPWKTYTYLFHTKAHFNSGYESLEFDKLIEKCETTPDYDERVEAARELGDYFYKGYYGIGLCNTDALFAMSPKIKDWQITPLEVVPSGFEYVIRAD